MKERAIRWGIKFGLFGIGLLLALAAIHGCGLDLAGPQLNVSISPSAGHPPFQITIAAACSAGGGTYTFTPPEGDAISSTEGQFTALVDRYPYEGTITWTDGDKILSEAITVGLINERPVAHDLALIPMPVQYHQKEIIDLRYLAHGCHNGNPIEYTGIEDPDYTKDGYSNENDHFLYRVEVWDKETETRETVYDSAGDPLPAGEFRSSPYFRWFPGWSEVYPPFPLDQMTCGPTPQPTPNPSTSPAKTKIIRVIVKEWGSEYAWEYEVSSSGSTCTTQPKEALWK